VIIDSPILAPGSRAVRDLYPLQLLEPEQIATVALRDYEHHLFTMAAAHDGPRRLHVRPLRPHWFDGTAAAAADTGRCHLVKEPIGAEHAYMQARGIVLRCRHCENVLLVITQRGGRYLLGFKESRWLQIG
jgi:hypothetical protein